MTYEQLAKTAKQRAYRLNQSGITTSALKKYENDLDVLLGEDRRGVSFKPLSKEDRRTLAKIMRDFIKNPLSTKRGIKSEYRKKSGNVTNDLQEMVDTLETMEGLGELSKAREKYGYDVEDRIHQDINDLFSTTDNLHSIINKAMVKYSKQKNFAKLTHEQRYNNLLNIVNEEVKRRAIKSKK